MRGNICLRNKQKLLLSVSLFFTVMILMSPLMYSNAAAANLPPPPSGWNFRAAGGWDRTVDLVPLARDYVNYVENNFGVTLPQIPQDVHAWVYTVYINWSKTQTFYVGLINVTSHETNFTMPEQLLIHHFTTPNGNDGMFATSFTMLAIFDETGNAFYGSYSLDKESWLSQLGLYDASIPPLATSAASIIPLTHSSDNNTWDWGMKYENLVTIWWRMFLTNGSYTPQPFAVMTLSELAFNYHLVITPQTDANPIGNITTRADYTIGEVSDLWIVQYSAGGAVTDVSRPPDIQSFLAGMKISILMHQRASVYRKPISATSENVNVRNASVDVSNSKILGKVGDELIYSTDFLRKLNYTLYPTMPPAISYESIVRTYPFKGIIDNSIFNDTHHIYALLHRVTSYAPQFFDPKGRGFEVTMADADSIYIITYPQWSGYRIVHDPYFAVFIGSEGGVGGALTVSVVVVGVAVLVVATSFLAIKKKGRTKGL